MALKSCRECGKKVSTEAGSCPSCGVPNPTSKKAPKKSENIYEEIWLYVQDAHKLCESTFTYMRRSLDKESEYRIWSISLYFYRGMFEASCEKHNLEKDDFKKAVIYCFRRGWDDEIYHKISNEKKDGASAQTYEDTENGLRYNDKVGKMCRRMIETGKESFKSDGTACFTALTKLWRDKNIMFTESALKRDVGNFFKKLF